MRRLIFILLLIFSNCCLSIEIPLIERGGVYTIPVTFNNTITLEAVVDTGAADTMIPLDVALVLIRNGSITDSDELLSSQYQQADGSTKELPRVNIKQLTIGGKVFNNISAGINRFESSILLGQSFFKNLTKMSLDLSRKVLVFEHNNYQNVDDITGTSTVHTWVLKDEYNVITIIYDNICPSQQLIDQGYEYYGIKLVPFERIKKYVRNSGRTVSDYTFAVKNDLAQTTTGCWSTKNRKAIWMRKIDSKVFTEDNFRIDSRWVDLGIR